RAPILRGDRDRLRARPAAAGTRSCRGRKAAGGVPGSRRRGTTLRGRILRLCALFHRSDVHRRPPAGSGRTAAGVPPRRRGRTGELDTGGGRPAEGQTGRAPRPPTPPPPPPPPPPAPRTPLPP